MMRIVSGIYRGRSLISPNGSQTRPTSSRLREAVFNICREYVEGVSFLDLFAGSGAMGLEALSRGANTAVFIDSHPNAIHCLKRNIEQLGVEPSCKVMKGEVFEMLRLLEKKSIQFGLIFVDPPYHTVIPGTNKYYSTEIIHWIDEHLLLEPGGFLFIEEKKTACSILNNLYTLDLVSSRQMGSTLLLEYQKRISK